MSPKIYVYKCVYDDGIAPCVDRGRLSLTVCKPQIRRTAAVGDYLVSFGGNAESPPNRLVYAARITARLPGGEYFDKPAFQTRQGCLYERTPRGLLRLRRDAAVHQRPADQLKDVGPAPEYPNAIALVSDYFRYFGAKGTDDWKAIAPRLARLVEHLGQGHRVNHSREIRDDLLRLIAQIWRDFPRKLNGATYHEPIGRPAQRQTCAPRGAGHRPRIKARRC